MSEETDNKKLNKYIKQLELNNFENFNNLVDIKKAYLSDPV